MGVPQVRRADWPILQMVHRRGAIPQHTLAELTGRRRSTVNGAVQRLLASSWLTQVGRQSGGRGRPAILLAVNGAVGCFVGIEITADRIRVAALAADGALLGQAESQLGDDHSLPAVLEQVDLSLRGLLSRLELDLCRVLRVWTGVNGVVDERGVVVTCASLGWRNEPLRKALAQRLALEVMVQGGASSLNAAAESLMGAGRDVETLVYYHVGRGISARMVSRGQPLTGFTQRAGEFGHVVVEPGGPRCACGNRGCLEAVASGPAILAAIKKILRRDLPESVCKLLRRRGEAGPASVIRAALHDCNGLADNPLGHLMERVADHVAMGAAMAVAAYDPQLLVLGGYLFEGNPAWVGRIERRLASMVLDWNERDLKVVCGEIMTRDRAVPGAAEACQWFWGESEGVAGID